MEKEKFSQRHKGTEIGENEIGSLIVDCAIRLHRALGPGLLETVYEVRDSVAP